MIKIAFHILGNEAWHAGTVYLFNLLKALRQFAGNRVSLCLLLSKEDQQAPADLLDLVDETLFYPKYRRWTLPWLASRGSARLLSHDMWGDRFFKKHGVQIIVFGRAPQGTKIPVFSFLPDFQHVHLPEMFTEGECLSRDLDFKRTAEESTRIILLSDFVRRDFEVFSPQHAHKARVVRPVSHIPRTVYEVQPQSVTEIYSLPQKFIYLPNQFWKHKNHRIVFLALKILKDRGTEPFLACSGSLNDYRHPDHFGRTLQEVSQWGIRNQIAFLGLIPREHLFMMMRQTICVLNPSLFEGFGLAVDEARSLGKRILLSEIPAHHEQDPPGAFFFNPKDEEDLAIKMKQVWDETAPGPDLKTEAEARESLSLRAASFAEIFLSVASEVILGT